MHPDMGGFRGRVGKCDGLIEGDARLVGAIELHEKAALDPEEMKIAGQFLIQRLDHRERGGRALDLGDCDRPIEGNDGRGLQPLQGGIELIDLRPIRVLRPRRMGVHAGDGGRT